MTKTTLLLAAFAFSFLAAAPGIAKEPGAVDAALQHAIAGNLVLADSLLREALAADPWNERTKALLRMTTAATTGEIDPGTAGHLLRSIQLLNVGNIKGGMSEIDAAIAQSPECALAYMHRGNARVKMGSVAESIVDYDRSIAIDSSDAVAYYNRGVAYIAQKDYSKASADFSKAIALDPKDTASYKNRGNVYQLRKMHEEAIADYDAALAINPRDSHAYYNRAEEWSATGQYDRAVVDYGKAIALDGNFAEAYDSRGFVYLVKLGKTELACTDWKRACELGRCSNYNLAKTKGYCK